MVAVYVPGEKATDITPNKDGGVLKEILSEGEGEEQPAEGNEVFVHYVGTLTDGSEFDSSRKRQEPFNFTLGKGSVIKGWEIAVATMKKGEKAMVVIGHEYGYGEMGSPPKIPPKATLHFEIELLRWKGDDLSEEKDESIIRRLIQKGTGYASPTEGDTLDVHLVGTYNGKVFEDREVSFFLGEGSEADVVPGVEIALEKFRVGDKALIQLKSHHAFGAAGKEDLGIPSNADVEYQVTLKNFKSAKKSYDMDEKEKLEAAAGFKEKGTNYFKQGKYPLAIKQYKKIISFLELDLEYGDNSLTDEQTAQLKNLLLIGHLNLAACYLKLEDYMKTIEETDKALEFDSSSEKALFRKGQAFVGLREHEKAKNFFVSIVKINPKNQAAIAQVNSCKTAIKEQAERDKRLYASMFKGLSTPDKPGANGQTQPANES